MSTDESSQMSENQVNLAHSTSQIVSSYVARNFLPAAELPDLIKSVTGALARLNGGAHPVVEDFTEAPAVPISKSMSDDYMICLECGARLKSLKRHLNAYHNLTPDQYRKKWKLPSDYPMVSPNYSEVRRKITRR